MAASTMYKIQLAKVSNSFLGVVDVEAILAQMNPADSAFGFAEAAGRTRGHSVFS